MKIFKHPKSEELTYELSGEYHYIDPLKVVGAEAIFYYYTSEPYAGSGDMLIWARGGWYYHNMGHCSCYGPLEYLSDSLKTPVGDTLVDVEYVLRGDQFKYNLKDVIALAREKEYI